LAIGTPDKLRRRPVVAGFSSWFFGIGCDGQPLDWIEKDTQTGKHADGRLVF
jgi:hypothetical protein